MLMRQQHCSLCRHEPAAAVCFPLSSLVAVRAPVARRAPVQPVGAVGGAGAGAGAGAGGGAAS